MSKTIHVGVHSIDGSRDVPRHALRSGTLEAACAVLGVRPLTVGLGGESRDQAMRDRVTVVIDDADCIDESATNGGAVLCIPVAS